MRTKSPVTEWREQYGLSMAELADLCNVTEGEIARFEAGEEGLIGEIQDRLTQRGETAAGRPKAPRSYESTRNSQGVPVAVLRV